MTFRPSAFASGKFIALMALAAAALGGCRFSALEPPATAKVAFQDRLILFAAQTFKGTRSLQVKYTDPWQREDYALFKGNGAQAEILHAAITERGFEVALEYLFTVDRSIETWNLSREYTLSWGERGRLQGSFAVFFYIPYRLVETNRPCFGFSAEWDDPPEDPDHRPGKVLFGYYCAKPGTVLTGDEIETLIGRIGIRGVTERLGSRPASARRGAPFAPAAIHDQNKATRLARGPSAGGEVGNPGFPFDLARSYSVDGNGGQGMK
jgi:hypothetical protein